MSCGTEEVVDVLTGPSCNLDNIGGTYLVT